MNTQSTFTQTGANSQQIQNQNNNFQNLKNVTTQNFQGANISNLTNIFNNNSGKKLSKNIVKKEIKVKENFVNRIDKNKLFRILIGASIVLPFVPIFMINGNDIEDIFNNYIYAYIFFFIAFSILMFPFFYVPNLFARTGIMKINDDNLFFKFGKRKEEIPFSNLRYKQDIIEQTSIGYNIIIRTIDDKEISFSVYSEQSKNDVKEALRNIYWNNKIVQICKNAEQDFLNWLDENKFSYLYINQDIESFSKLFTNQVKSPNFLLLIDSIGLVAVNIMNYTTFKDKHFSLNYESEFKNTLTFEKLFKLPVWYVYKNNDQWLWISALKAIEVGEIKTNSETKEQFLSLNIDDFTIVKSNSDICKLWEQKVPFSDKLI
ncbi:hypothetical protein [Aliarcobacter butzleri]|uniref:hypothetical protein n=1 Tax=Aliarcobacter butzleri TaxID=28197 RepID=UPI003AF7EB32